MLENVSRMGRRQMFVCLGDRGCVHGSKNERSRAGRELGHHLLLLYFTARVPETPRDEVSPPDSNGGIPCAFTFDLFHNHVVWKGWLMNIVWLLLKSLRNDQWRVNYFLGIVKLRLLFVRIHSQRRIVNS